MPKNVEKMTLNYSPNFDSKKRKKKKIKYIIFHYTGMKNDKLAIRKLTSETSKVSCHYYIDKNGKLIQMVPELYTSWHAGLSSWKKDKLINHNSIGIEISNPGHQHGYKPFGKKQLKILISIAKYLIKKYNIKKYNILGHSDIAPLRKKDPGEKFPWKLLAHKNIGLWHKIDSKKCARLRGNKNKLDKVIFFKKLNRFGYSTKNLSYLELKKIVKSFQRRFRPQLVNGKIDNECVEILKSLISQ